jgi:hypothetical protein
MPYQSFTTMPSAAHTKTSRRLRSANDRLTVSFSTSRNLPEVSHDDSSDDDNKVEDNTDDDPQPDSAKQLPLRQPTTPSRARPELPREPASDPGPLRIDPEAFYSRVRPYQQAGKLPCGHKPYANPAGKWGQTHMKSCFTCYVQKEMDRGVYEKKGVEQVLQRTSTSPTRQRSTAVARPHSLSDYDTSSASADEDNNIDNDNENDKAKVESKPVAKKRNKDQVATMVHHRLIQAAKKKLTEHEKAGYLYILRSREKPGLLKLGYSERDVSKRGKEHTCVGDFTWVYVGNQVAHVKKAEELAKLDLDHLRRDWWCPNCLETHREWFQVDEERAMEVTKRWTTWINKETPYAKDGKLKLMWAWLMDVRRVPRVLFGQDDHQARWTMWKHVLSRPSSQAKIAWADYSNQIGLEASIQQPDRDESTIPYWQYSLYYLKQSVVRQNLTLVGQALGQANNVRHSDKTPIVTFIKNLHVYQYFHMKATDLD